MEKGLFNVVKIRNKRWRAKAENRFNELNKRRWDKRMKGHQEAKSSKRNSTSEKE